MYLEPHTVQAGAFEVNEVNGQAMTKEDQEQNAEDDGQAGMGEPSP